MRFLYIRHSFLLFLILIPCSLFSQSKYPGGEDINIKLRAATGIDESYSPVFDSEILFFIPYFPSTEFKLSYLPSSSEISFGDLDDLRYNSHTVLIGLNYYLIDGLYIGARFGNSFNKIEEESQARYQALVDAEEKPTNISFLGSSIDRTSPVRFTGWEIYANAGYSFYLLDFLEFNLQAEFGRSGFELEEGEDEYFSSGCWLFGCPYSETKKFIRYNITAGIKIRLLEI